MWNDFDAVKLLVQAGIDINKHGEHGFTPLHCACAEGNADIVKFLLDNGANPFARTIGDLPFTTARLNSNDAISEMLLPYMKAAQKSKHNPDNLHKTAMGVKITELENFISEQCNKNI